VAVGTAGYLAAFLTAVVDDSLFALWWLIGLRGLRRGEACGLRWTDLDLDHGLLFVVRNRTTAGYRVVEGEPKTAAGVRAVALDKHTVKVLRDHRRRQLAQRERWIAAGKLWHDSGYVFVRKDGSPIHPGYASGRFRLLVRHHDLPPIRLHDLRHGAASLAHEAGADLKTLQDLLGHSSIVVTADTYTSVLPLAQRRCADATAKLVLDAAHRSRQKIRQNGRRNRPAPRPTTGTPTPTGPTTSTQPQLTRRKNSRNSRGVTTTTWQPQSTPDRTQRTSTRRSGR
jgi:integrase